MSRRVVPVLASLVLLGSILITVFQDSGAATPSDSAACPAAAHLASSVTWPALAWKTCFAGTITQSSPTVANWHGQTIVAVGDELGFVHVLDAATGQELSGWPRAMQAPAGKHGAIEASPTIGYLDGPKRPPSIIVGSGSTWVSNSVGEVEAFSLDGKPRWVFQVGRAAGTAVGVISSPAVGDIIGAGAQVVFGSWDHKIYVLNAQGQQLGFAYDNADTIWSSPALYRLPGQRGDDIFLGSDASGRPFADATGSHRCIGGFVADYRWSPATIDPDTLKVGAGLARRWFQCINQSIWSSPAVGIIDNSHRPAVVVGSSFFEQPFPSGTDKLYAFYADTGAPLPKWPVATSGPTLGSPAIGVIKGSGLADVVDTSFVCSALVSSSCLPQQESRVAAWNGKGQLLWSQGLSGPTDFSSPILVPLLDHATNDVLVGSPNGLYPLDGANGQYLYGTNLVNQFAAINPSCRVFSTPAVADVAGSGPGSGWHVFESCGGPPTFSFPGELAAYPLPVTPSVAPGWPMFHDSANHVGVSEQSFAH